MSLKNMEIGGKFGMLTVVGPAFRIPYEGKTQTLCLCQCDCGNYLVCSTYTMRKGHKLTCGCKVQKTKEVAKIRRGLYRIWYLMKHRCYNKKSNNYHNYGARGIEVCREWLDDYGSFIDWAIEAGHKKELELDRADNDGPYSPKNCRFVTRSQNQRNKRNNNIVLCFGEKKTATDWSEDKRCKVSAEQFRARIANGWEPEQAMTFMTFSRKKDKLQMLSAFGESKTIREWSLDPRCVISLFTLKSRIKGDWKPETAIALPKGEDSPYKYRDDRKPTTRTIRKSNRILTAFGESKPMCDWGRDVRCVVSLHALHKRLKHGWDHEKAIASRNPKSAYLTAFGETKTLTEWSKDSRCMVDKAALHMRIKSGWDTESAISKTNPSLVFITAFGETKTITQWSRDSRCRVGKSTLAYRLKTAKWSNEDAITKLRYQIEEEAVKQEGIL